MKIDVCFTPQEYSSRQYEEDHAVAVLDIFRATTSMIAAFASGCQRIIPAATIEEALSVRQELPAALLAGGRKALPIEGFNLGNSPYEYTPAKVGGRTIIMTTTNGTVALKAATKAARVFAGAFVNAAALIRELAGCGLDIVILCAGTQGRFTLEDSLCAGLLAEQLAAAGEHSDTALAARAMYSDCRHDLAGRVGQSVHARYLAAIGFASDIDFCLRHDVFAVVPEYIDGALKDPAIR